MQRIIAALLAIILITVGLAAGDSAAAPTELCDHAYTYTVVEESDPEYTDTGDDATHTAVICSVTRVKCSVCEADILTMTGDPVIREEKHRYQSGTCIRCGHRNPCPHAQTHTEEHMALREEVVSFDTRGHTVKGVAAVLTVCDDCFEIIGQESKPDCTMTEAHEYENSICTVCGYHNICDHRNIVREIRFDSRQDIVEPLNKYNHRRTGPGWIDTVCADCGEHFRTEPAEELTREEPHEMAGRKCSVCGWVDESISTALSMPVGDEYSKVRIGTLTFRNNAFRQNAATGKVYNGTDRMMVLWDREYTLESTEAVTGGYWWPAQPLIVQWSKQVREKLPFAEGYQPYTGMKEVIACNAVGVIRFYDLLTGEETRDPIRTERVQMSGSLSLHPGGIPYLCAGEITERYGQTSGVGLRQYNLYDLSEFRIIDGRDDSVAALACGNGAFFSAPLIDRTTGRLVTAGTNGFVYNLDLGIQFDYEAGTLTVAPEGDAIKKKSDTLSPQDTKTGYMAPVSTLSAYVYCADLAGRLFCINTTRMGTEWSADLEDAVVCAMPLEIQDGRTVLYAANTLTNRDSGKAAVVSCNALTGDEYWRKEFSVEKRLSWYIPLTYLGGFIASPVVGENQLKDLIYYTITGLTQEGSYELGLDGTPESALIAMEKQTGDVVWTLPMDDYCYSSPVAVYDENGAGMIIQCASDGTVHMLDGLTGKETDSLQLKGSIDASPVVYDEMMVITTSDDGHEYVYGIMLFASLPDPDNPLVYETFAPFETPLPSPDD